MAAQTVRQGPVNCCLAYNQPGGSSLTGKAGTDRASVNFNNPYCPELALTMNRGVAVPNGSRLAANWPDLFPRELPAPLDALQTSLQAEHLLNTMNLARRVGPSAPLHPQGRRRVCAPRSPQYTFAHAAPGWRCYGENKGVNVPDDLAGQSTRPSTAPGCTSALAPCQRQTTTTAVQTETPRPRQHPIRRARSLQSGLATSEGEGLSTSGPAENGRASECELSSGCEEPVQGDKRFRTFSIACGPGSPRARFNSAGPAYPDAPWVPPGRFYLDKAAADASSPQRKRAMSAARLQGRQWEREAAESPLRRTPSPLQGQRGVKSSLQLRGVGSGSPQRQWGPGASSRRHSVSRRGVRPSRGTGSADLEADPAAEQEAAEAAWAGQEGLSLDQRFTQQAAAGAAAAQAGRLRLRPQRWIRLPHGGARSKTLEGSGMEGVATARRPAARRRLGADSQDWQVAPTKGSPSAVRPQVQVRQRSPTQEQARAATVDVPERAAQKATKAPGQHGAAAAPAGSDATAPPAGEPSFSLPPQEAAHLLPQPGQLTPSGGQPHRQPGGSTIVVDPAAFRRGQVQQQRQQQRSQAAARPTVVLLPDSPESDRDPLSRSVSESPELPEADEAASEEHPPFAGHNLRGDPGASRQRWQGGVRQKESVAAAQQRSHLPRGEAQPSGASSAEPSRPVSLRASPARQLRPDSPSLQHFGASSAGSSPARLLAAQRGQEGAHTKGLAAGSRPGRLPAAHSSQGAVRGGSTLPSSSSPQRLTAEDSTDSLAELERLIEEQHRQLVAKGVLPAEPILPTDVDFSDLSLHEVSLDSSLTHIEHLAGHLQGGHRHPRGVRAAAEVLGDDLLREDAPDWSCQSPRSASPSPWQPAPRGAAQSKRTLLDALSSVLDAQLASETYSDGSLTLSGGSSLAELDVGRSHSHWQEQGRRQDRHAELGCAHRYSRHHRRQHGREHGQGQQEHAELEGGHDKYDDSHQQGQDCDPELAGKRHQEQQQGQALGQRQHAPPAADASVASDPAAAGQEGSALQVGSAGSAGGPAAAFGLNAGHSILGDTGMASQASAASSADCKAVPAEGDAQAELAPRKAASSGAGLAEAGPSSHQQPAVLRELPEGEHSWEAAPSERRQVRAEASLGFGSWHSAQETGLSSGEASPRQLSDSGSGDLGPLERAVETARALRPPAPGAARQPPRPGSSVFHSVFHPSDAATSAEGDHTARREGRLGGGDASAAADDWLLEEGSGYGSFHAGTDTEDGHATDAPQSSSWHPDDHCIGTGPVDLCISE